jgi:hypothetical protein
LSQNIFCSFDVFIRKLLYTCSVFMRPKSFGVKLLLICISLGLVTASCYKVESQRAISENTFL